LSQTDIVAEVMQRDVQAIGRERLTSQSMVIAEMLREPADARM
jgi:hypothetical protein